MLGTVLNSRLQRTEKKAFGQSVDFESGNRGKTNDNVSNKIIMFLFFSFNISTLQQVHVQVYSVKVQV